MPEESFIEFTVDYFTAADLSQATKPERWTLKQPTPVAMVFPDPDGLDFIASLKRADIYLGSLGQQYQMPGQAGVIVSLLFDGLVRRISASWRIIHPAYYGVDVPIPSIADIFIFGKNPPPEIALGYLNTHLRAHPPTALVQTKE